MIIHLRKRQLISAFLGMVFVLAAFVSSAAFGAKESNVIQRTLPVVMYHHVVEDSEGLGKYVISAQEFIEDLELIESMGYTTVDVEDIINFVRYGEILPDKIIMLTFDDGFESVYATVEPVLREKNMCCSAAVIGTVAQLYSEIDDHNLAYSYMNWTEIAALAQGKTVEIQNHTYDLHHNETGERKGMGRLSGESEGAYINTLKNDLVKCQNQLTSVCGFAPRAIMYPYGIYNSITRRLIKEIGFEVSFLCEERINTLTQGNAECLYDLGRYNRPSGVSSEEFFRNILMTR